MDLLGTVLQSLRLIDSSVGSFEFEGAWAFRLHSATKDQVFLMSPENCSFHLAVDGEEPQLVQIGDTAVVFGVPFVMSSSPTQHPLSLEDVWRERELPPLGRNAERKTPTCLRWPHEHSSGDLLITMALQLQDVAHSPVLSVMPRFFVLRSSETLVYPWWQPVLRSIKHEIDKNRPGYEAAARLLAHLTFVELIRTYAVDVGVDKASWLKGIADPQIGRALGLIYSDAEREWRLETLAEAANMARSTFSRRFQQLVGRSPMEYLRSVRLEIAAQRLAAGEAVGDVAASIGYRSEWAFRQAFSAQFAASPKRYAKVMRG